MDFLEDPKVNDKVFYNLKKKRMGATVVLSPYIPMRNNSAGEDLVNRHVFWSEHGVLICCSLWHS